VGSAKQQQESRKPGTTPAAAAVKYRPCVSRRLAWALLGMLLLLAVVGTSVGVVVGRRSALEQRQDAAARASAASADTLLYSVNIRMAAGTNGEPAPTCRDLFGGPNPRTVSVHVSSACVEH
jgi:hypothetical protein